VDHLLSGLRQRGVLDQPTGLLIRIGLNALDRLEAMGDTPLRLPRFLEGPLGRTVSCRDFARSWRGAAGQARALLDLLSRYRFGQHVHLARLMVRNACPDGPECPTAARVPGHLAEQARGWSEGPALLAELGRDLPAEAVRCLERLGAERDALLARRRRAAAAAPRPIRASVVPEAEEAERERIECRMLVLFAAYVRRLWQRAESLPYVNDRPYTLALYLLFGQDIFPPICRQVEFDVEYLSAGCEDALRELESAPR
jgi:hypothetical protein